MKDYNEIAREVLRRRDERLAAAAKKRAAIIKTASTVACFCLVAFSTVVAVKLYYVNKSVVETVDRNFNTLDPENGDDPISAYITDTTEPFQSTDSSATDTDSSSQSESEDGIDSATDTTYPADTDPRDTETERREPVTIAPPEDRPEPPESTNPPSTDRPETTVPTDTSASNTTTPPETTKPPVTEPPVTEPNDTEPNDTEPPVTEPPVTDPPVTAPPVTDPPVTEPPVTDSPRPPSRPEDPYPPDFWDPPFSGGFEDIGGSIMGPASVDYITEADVFYMLYFYHSNDYVTEEPIFEDVAMGKWYSEAITWAAKNGIVYSVSSNSGPYLDPFDYVKRQDLACYLYALAGSPEVNGSIEDYFDFEEVEEYAVTAMTWCFENDILSDIGGKLSPLSKITLSAFKDILDELWYI